MKIAISTETITILRAQYDDMAALQRRVAELSAALEPFTRVVIGEHRHDDENVWHSLKAYHFRDARRAFKGETK